MDKRYQVFVSSTFEDLQEERKEVMQALLELDCIPAGMELFPAANEDQWSLIKRVIDDSDYYILIIGGRYGSTNEEGKSYTQMEYEYAISTHKPTIAFLHKNPSMIPSGKCEQDPEKKKKLDDFKALVQKKLVKYWENADNLGSVVSRSMVNLIKNNPAEGWVRTSSVVDERSILEISRLQKENEELRKQLKQISTEAPAGSEKFAQGDDEVKIDFSFEGKRKDQFGFTTFSCHSSKHFTWNELFSCIAPKMINESPEQTLSEALDHFISTKYDWKSDDNFKALHFANMFCIEPQSFDLIIVQFRALGLITLGTNKRNIADKNTYWKLTPYGDTVLNQLLAIKK